MSVLLLHKCLLISSGHWGSKRWSLDFIQNIFPLKTVELFQSRTHDIISTELSQACFGGRYRMEREDIL